MLASSAPILIVGILVVLLAVVAFVFVTAARRGNVGALSRETKQRDKAAAGNAPAGSELVPAEGDDGETPRERVDAALQASSGGTVEARGAGDIAPWEPLDIEDIGLNRRQFFLRGILALVGVGGIGTFGVAALAFIWPTGSTGFGGVINAGATADITNSITTAKTPFYVPAARTYLQLYPASALPNAKKAYAPDPTVLAGMEQGFVALYQRCVHLGCRVPWCLTSQWFECPCHGSKYNAVGEKQGGPAPRGLDRFKVTVANNISVDTSTIITGPPIGTNTTGQQPEGPHCV
jgi:cytochrome b6-f complex iron-sulfur subunit